MQTLAASLLGVAAVAGDEAFILGLEADFPVSKELSSSKQTSSPTTSNLQT